MTDSAPETIERENDKMTLEARQTGIAHPVIGRSNGHRWIDWRSIICCADCGFIRRADDKNKPCRGTVSVGPRQ